MKICNKDIQLRYAIKICNNKCMSDSTSSCQRGDRSKQVLLVVCVCLCFLCFVFLMLFLFVVCVVCVVVVFVLLVRVLPVVCFVLCFCFCLLFRLFVEESLFASSFSSSMLVLFCSNLGSISLPWGRLKRSQNRFKKYPKIMLPQDGLQDHCKTAPDSPQGAPRLPNMGP